jgi:hypothetical protein
MWGLTTTRLALPIDTAWNASFHSGDTADVWIIYNATTKNLSVSWTYQRTSNSLENTSLSYQIDLMKVLPESVQIGFSAATGLSTEQHTLRSWEFNSSLDIKETSGKKVRKISLIVILTVVVVGVIVIASVMLWICKGKKKETTEIVNLTSINDALREEQDREGFLMEILFQLPTTSRTRGSWGKEGLVPFTRAT